MDQAAGLRQRTVRPVQVLAVASGKGGVGKTSTSVNLSIALAQAGRKVVLMDADLGLANVDVLLGLPVSSNLSHVLEGRCGLDDILVDGPAGIKVVPAASGKNWMAQLGAAEHAGLIRAFSDLSWPLDTLIVDTAAGIADGVVRFAQAAHEVLVVVCDEPASLADAYALIKVLNRDFGVHRFQMVANMVASQVEGAALHRKLTRVTDRFLEAQVHLAGVIPNDEWLKRAIQRQGAVVDMYPACKSAQAFKKLATRAEGWTIPEGPRGNLEFFVERLGRSESMVMGTT